MRLVQLDTIARFLDLAERWDGLWEASDVAAPTARNAHVALWIEHFAPRSQLRCLIVEDGGVPIAALPLVQSRLKGVLPSGGMAANCWSAAGQLLVHPDVPDRALDMLAASVAVLPWPLLWLEGINPTTTSWQRFLSACERLGLRYEFRHDRTVGLIDIGDDWDAYEAARSKNHHRNMRKARHRLESQGEVLFRMRRICDVAKAESLLRQAFQIEEQSWKAVSGTPALRDPAACNFFLAQGRLLASWDVLDVSFLELNGQPIAFEYGYRGKGVHLGHKTGYVDAYSSCSPGQLLMMEMLKALHADPQIRLVDSLGPLSGAISRWATRSYPEGRLFIARPGMLGQTLWQTYRAVRRLKPRRAAHAPGVSHVAEETTAARTDSAAAEAALGLHAN